MFRAALLLVAAAGSLSLGCMNSFTEELPPRRIANSFEIERKLNFNLHTVAERLAREEAVFEHESDLWPVDAPAVKALRPLLVRLTGDEFSSERWGRELEAEIARMSERESRWTEADRRTVSFLYLVLAVMGEDVDREHLDQACAHDSRNWRALALRSIVSANHGFDAEGSEMDADRARNISPHADRLLNTFEAMCPPYRTHGGVI